MNEEAKKLVNIRAAMVLSSLALAAVAAPSGSAALAFSVSIRDTCDTGQMTERSSQQHFEGPPDKSDVAETFRLFRDQSEANPNLFSAATAALERSWKHREYLPYIETSWIGGISESQLDRNPPVLEPAVWTQVTVVPTETLSSLPPQPESWCQFLPAILRSGSSLQLPEENCREIAGWLQDTYEEVRTNVSDPKFVGGAISEFIVQLPLMAATSAFSLGVGIALERLRARRKKAAAEEQMPPEERRARESTAGQQVSDSIPSIELYSDYRDSFTLQWEAERQADVIEPKILLVEQCLRQTRMLISQLASCTRILGKELRELLYELELRKVVFQDDGHFWNLRSGGI